MPAGLNANGFTRKTLVEILASLKQRGIDEFGVDFNTEDDSVFAQLTGVFALECDEIWQGLEGAYSAYTLNGAEGVFLDDLFSRHNITRLDATAGTGTVYIESDSTTVLPETLLASTGITFQASNSIDYTLSTDKIIDIDSTAAYKIVTADITPAVSYTIFCEDDAGVTQSTAIVANDFGVFVTAIKTFVDATNTSTAGKTFDFTTAGEEEFYLGFDLNKELDPLASEIEFYISPAIGNRFSVGQVTAAETGLNPLPSNGILDMSPKFSGFISANNVTAFNSGANTESDAAFRIRFNQIIDASASGCDRASIETAILELDNVVSARIYENPTPVATAEAAAYSYNSVVNGGDPDEIAQALFDNGPINVKTDGTTTIVKTSSAGDTTDIKFTVATNDPLSVRITYDTLTGSVFTAVEELDIKAAIATLALNFGVGTTVYNIQLNSAVVSSLGYGRLVSLVVETELVTGGAGFTTADYVPAFDHFPSIADVDVTFVKV